MAGRSLHIHAPAKINLYLGVHDERDERGYHRVDSIMMAVGLWDIITVEPADELTVETDPASLAPMRQNTAYRAAVAMGEHYGRRPDVRILIKKLIPICAGLGGPSTDAAAVMLALAELWGIDRNDPALDVIARGIGADVPFFLHGSPAYHAGGGDVLAEEYALPPSIPVVLIKPVGARVSTVEAYRAFDADPVPAGDLESIRAALRAQDVRAAAALVSNNLAPVAWRLEPRIAEVLSFLQKPREGVLAVNVCGSGACCFALCAGADASMALYKEAQQRHDWWSELTLTPYEPYRIDREGSF